MKKFLMVLPLVLVVCLTLSSQVKDKEISTEDLEKELRATFETWAKAYVSRDIDTIVEIEGDAIGYGYRSAAPRLFDKKVFEARTKWWLNSLEIAEGIPKDEPIFRVEGDVGLVLVTIIEKTKPKDGELKSIEARCSFTFIKVDGKWKMALYHRDTQFAK